MPFQSMSAEQYRALDHSQVLERRKTVIDLLNAETLPEGVTDEMLLEESRTITNDLTRRNAAIDLHNQGLAKIQGGEGKTIETFGNDEGAVKRNADPYGTVEYRTAFMDYFTKGIVTPQLRADGAGTGTVQTISINGQYTASTDVAPYVPTTLMAKVIRELEERGILWSRVQKISIKGGVEYNTFDFKPTAYWITQNQTSPYQKDEENTVITFTFHQLECRIAQTFLNAAVTLDVFEEMFAQAVSNAMIDALEASIVSGSGTGEMLGITNDTRITNSVSMSATDVENWKQWHRKVKAAIPRQYRRRGTFIMGQGTWDTYIETLSDDNQRPISATGYNAVTGEEEYRLMGLPVLTVPDSVLESFDTASTNDVFAIFGNLNDYVVNTQPEMPLSVIRYADHDNNLIKTKALMAVDGKVLDPYGFMLIKKGAGA